MFELATAQETPPAGDAACGEDWFDPTWPDPFPEPEDPDQPAAARCAPSGWTALELDYATVEPGRLSDTDLIDTIVGFERLASWAGARQAELIAEFARRRPGQDSPPDRSDVPGRCSGFAPDEIALALRLSRTTAANRMAVAQTVVRDLPATLAAWSVGVIDTRKAQAIAETCYVLTGEQRSALEARVLPRAGTQTLAQLRASLTRAVLAIDPEGAAARFRERRRERRVEVNPDTEGMATLWALLSAPDATAAYQRLSQLARGLGAQDPRSMDARRADLLIDLLTGRRCAATTDLLDDNHLVDDHPLDDHHDPAGHASDCANHDGDRACGDADSPPGDAFPTSAAGADPAPDSGTGTTWRVPCPGPAAAADPTTVDRPRPGHDCPTTREASTGPGKPLVSVIVPITMLLGLDEQPGELVGYGPIPAELARQIAAQGTWRRLLTDPATGALLDYGRRTYSPPAGLADFVRARDVYCRNPICRHRAATADLDHTVAWKDGGSTCEGNLHACCRHDHLIKTFGPGWQVTQHPDGRVSWTTPTGHVYTSHPHAYRTPPHPPPDTATPHLTTADTTAGHDPPEDEPPPF